MMQDSDQNKKTRLLLYIGIINLSLILLVCITLALVFNVSVNVTGSGKTDLVLCITPDEPLPAGQVQSILGQKRSTSAFAGNETPKSTGEAGGLNSGFGVFDSDQAWLTETKVNIFQHNDLRVLTDGTGSADHVIAPGTSNHYVFTLKNDKNRDVRYQLLISAGNDSEYQIPVDIGVKDPRGKELVTNGKTRIGEFGDIVQLGSLAANSEESYSIDWEWVFENGTDDYDTMLGDIAVDEEIPCHVNITVVAEFDDESQQTSTIIPQSSTDVGKPDESSTHEKSDHAEESSKTDTSKTGDSSGVTVVIAVSMLIFAAAVVTVVMLTQRKRKKD